MSQEESDQSVYGGERGRTWTHNNRYGMCNDGVGYLGGLRSFRLPWSEAHVLRDF